MSIKLTPYHLPAIKTGNETKTDTRTPTHPYKHTWSKKDQTDIIDTPTHICMLPQVTNTCTNTYTYTYTSRGRKRNRGRKDVGTLTHEYNLRYK